MSNSKLARAIIASLLGIVTLMLLASASTANEFIFELSFRVDAAASGLEFFAELPPDSEFVSFTASDTVRVVHKVTDSGVWIGLIAENLEYGGSVMPGQLTLKSAARSCTVKITHVTAYSALLDADGKPMIDEITAVFTESRQITTANPTPPPYEEITPSLPSAAIPNPVYPSGIAPVEPETPSNQFPISNLRQNQSLYSLI